MRIILSVTMALIATCPLSAQIKDTINRSSIYGDSVLRQLVRASQLAADRQRSVMNRSALRANETTGIRRQSVLSPSDLSQLDRLSAFAGDRLRALEEASEFKEREVSRMQASYQGEVGTGDGRNRVAEIAEKNSTMPRPQVERILSASDAREWAMGVRKRAVAVGAFADILQRRSLASPARSRAIQRMSTDP